MMRNTLVQFLTGLSASCFCLMPTIASAQTQPTTLNLTGRTGNFTNIPVTLSRAGWAEFSARSTNGDIDMLIHNSAGRLIGSGRQVGNELVGGRLPAGRYLVHLRMVKCARLSPCNVRYSATLNGQPLVFPNARPQVTNSSAISSLQTCINYLRASQGHGQAAAQGICENILRSYR